MHMKHRIITKQMDMRRHTARYLGMHKAVSRQVTKLELHE